MASELVVATAITVLAVVVSLYVFLRFVFMRDDF